MMRLVLLICCVLFSKGAFAQYKIQYFSVNEKDKSLVKELEFDLNRLAPPRNNAEIYATIRSSLNALYEDGYLEANVDSFFLADSIYKAWWFLGNKYKFAKLRLNNNESKEIFSNAGLKDRLYSNHTFSPTKFSRLTNSLLQWSANNGYPFAEVRLDSVSINNNNIDGSLVIDKGPLIVLDTAMIKGDANLSKIYLLNYLSIKPGDLYNEELIKRITSRLKELPFATEVRPFEIEFLPGLARPVFFLQQKKASQFNGVIGVQSDNANSGKTYITGDVQLRLHNAFGRAELFDLKWTNPQPRTQDLKIKFNYPFLFNTPFGVDVDLSLYKKDTIYLEFNRQLAARYYLSGNNSFKVFVDRFTSNLISTKGYSNATTLPSFADVGSTTYGLGFQFQRLDYLLNPRRGYAIEFNGGTGTRKISKNSKFNDAVYDSLDLNTTKYKANFTGDIYFPIAGRSVINFGTISAYLQSPTIFENELYRFGGLKSLRGFDELSLLASFYVIGKAEYRFILEQNSYLLLFYNIAYYERKGNSTFLSDTPYGFGAGLTFETKLGIFSFTYAIGSQQGNPIIFRSAKIHFGLINYF